MSVPLTLLGLLERGPSRAADLRWIDHTAARLDMIARTVLGQS